jgi:4-hydroxybenzoate polyprenyltransferase
VWLFFAVPLEYVGCIGVLATGALLVYQHSIVKANDLSRLNAAFFTTNAFVSMILFVTIAIDIFVLG